MERRESCYRENGFFQSAQNVRKLGAYYTDVDHCRRIGNLFDFDQAEEICVLEPSIGDGQAVLTVTGEREHCKIFGVELNRDTYMECLQDNPKFTAVLNEDFLKGVKISNNKFSFCFANPPYGESAEEKKRLEQLFLERIAGYMRNGGYLALVIPYGVFKEEKFFRAVLGRFSLEGFYRFDDKEYEKYHQICAILKKKSPGYLRSYFEEKFAAIQRLENYPYLPEEAAEKHVIIDSRERDIDMFTTRIFDYEAAAERIGASPLWAEIGTKVFQRPYTGCNLTSPIVPVSNEIGYLLAVTGGGEGLSGNAEDQTLHLQRGVAKRIQSEDAMKNDDGKVQKLVQTTYTEIKLNIVENSGRITQL